MRGIALAGGVHGILTEMPATPCGACRQVMVQYERKYGNPFKIIAGSAGKVQVFDSAQALLPFVFTDI